jgi:NADH dehydrogenase
MIAMSKQAEQVDSAVSARSAAEALAPAGGQQSITRPPQQLRPPRVVVVGAGFGGLSVARNLANRDVAVLVVDRNNYHGFWPLLYQVATAGLEGEAIGYPVRAIFGKYANINFQMAEVQGVDFEQKAVLTDRQPVPYDYLVLAAGSTNNYFGNESLARETFGMKTISDAEELRDHILANFEIAVRELDAERRKALLSFVIVGGGPTGVELAGALVELFRHVMLQDYPELDMNETRVILVEGMDSLLLSFHPSLQRTSQHKLAQMGVEVWCGKLVTNVQEQTVTFQDGSQLSAGTVVWTAGVRAADLCQALDVERARAGRARVTPTLTLPGHPEVFVIGDMAYLEGYKGTQQAHPMLAPVAMQQGSHTAANILAHHRGEPLRAFHYSDKGQMATIGRRAAVLQAFGIRLTGFIAWLGWLVVHIIMLIGFRNRLVVLMNWAYNYFTYDRGVRVIIRKGCNEPSQAQPGEQ